VLASRREKFPRRSEKQISWISIRAMRSRRMGCVGSRLEAHDDGDHDDNEEEEKEEKNEDEGRRRQEDAG